MSREHDGQLRFAAVRPVGGGSLRIEVDDGGVLSERGRSDGQVQGQGGFSGAAFLADDGDGFHRRSLHNIKSANVQACNLSILQACNLSILHGFRIDTSRTTLARSVARQRKDGQKAGSWGLVTADPRAGAGDMRMIRLRIRGC